MSDLELFAILDCKSSAYSNPFTANSDLEAQRIFGDMLIAGGNLISQHPEDFSLYRIGRYDNKSGIIGDVGSIYIISGLDMLNAIRVAQANKKADLDLDTTDKPSSDEVAVSSLS